MKRECLYFEVGILVKAEELIEKDKKEYSSGLNMVRLIYELFTTKQPILYESVVNDLLDVDRRTVERYVKAINDSFMDTHGEDLICEEGTGKRKYLKINHFSNTDYSRFDAFSLYFGMLFLSSLEDTVIKDSIQELLDQTIQTLSNDEKKKIKKLHKKFYYSSFGVKQYKEHDDSIDIILRGLLNERKLKVQYASSKRICDYVIHPYTLLMHRDSLFLLAFSEYSENIRMYKVENFQEIEYLKDEFDYPEEYLPTQVFEDSFGIFISDQEEQIEVEVEFQESTYDYVSKRKWSKNQKVSEIQNGHFTFSTQVRDLFEIGHWLLSMGGTFRVVKPDELRIFIIQESDEISRLNFNIV